MDGSHLTLEPSEGTSHHVKDVALLVIVLHVLLDFQVRVVTHVKQLFDLFGSEGERFLVVAVDKELDAIYDKLGGISNACTCKEDSNA